MSLSAPSGPPVASPPGPALAPASMLASAPIVSVDAAQVFQRAWATYEKFVTHNWMCHRQAYRALRHVAEELGPEPIAVADFGCGDAASAWAALDRLPVRRFVAIDRVAELLSAAERRWAERGVTADCRAADLLDAAASPPAEPVDLLLAAYSAHHLAWDDKRRFLDLARRWMKPRGRIVLIDLTRRRDENRRRYLDRFLRHVDACCGAFDASERRLVRDHIEACDFPESAAGWAALLQSAGWTAPRLRFRDPREFYAVLTSGPER